MLKFMRKYYGYLGAGSVADTNPPGSVQFSWIPSVFPLYMVTYRTFQKIVLLSNYDIKIRRFKYEHEKRKFEVPVFNILNLS